MIAVVVTVAHERVAFLLPLLHPLVTTHDLGALLCLGEDERALQDRLDKVTDAFRAPQRMGRVKLFRRFNIGWTTAQLIQLAFLA
jgi:hypothetical protein